MGTLVAFLVIVAGSVLTSGALIGMRHRSRSFFVAGWRRQTAAGLVIAAIVCLPVSWALGRAVHRGSLNMLDERIYAAVYAGRGSLLARAATYVTEIGSITTTGFVAVVIGLIFGIRHRSVLPLILAAGAWQLSIRTQRLIDGCDDRPKPSVQTSIGPHGGFPSGGVSRIIVVVGLIALFLAADVVSERQLALLVGLSGAICWVEIVSRAVLGRHWPMDLVVGALEGLSILVLFAPTVRWISRPVGRSANRSRGSTA